MNTIPDATKLATARATNPHASAWVAANAGSGKTFVLTQRVLRLLLDGQDPSTLLCLTFTKAAAAEMATRVFDQLAAWTRLDDAALRGTLQGIQGRATVADMARARSLFARALETPGGLKIQTIHAFCESLLHQFPLEAGVAASFTVLDDREANALMDQARAGVLAKAARGQDADLRLAFEGAAARFADTTIADHLDAVLMARHALARRFDAHNLTKPRAQLDHLVAEHAAMLGLAEADEAAARAALADPMPGSPTLPKSYVESLRGLLPELTKTDQDNLRDAWGGHNAPTAEERLEDWASLLFTKGAPRGLGRHFPRLKKADDGLIARLEAEQIRGLNLAAHVGFIDLMRLSLAVLAHFEALKTRAGALDFGDLIARSASLLNRSEAQAWVRYKMDQRINHILVDEAQDTSADQWSIIKALSEEFFAGQGLREDGLQPTFFAVGDEKQSIYSFQGADPKHFDGTRRGMETKAAQAKLEFASPVPLVLSFRSTVDILSAVDTVFSRNEALQGVSTDTGLAHQAHRKARGRVEIWPVIRGASTPEPEDWAEPVDALPAAHIQLAAAIAKRVRNLVDSGGKSGDILILLRTRGALADAINKALKQQQVPVAGTDRLMLGEHIAVEDMMALMQVALLPQDDLALACLLTSPLVGLTDQQLESLSVGRKGHLIDALNAPPPSLAGDPAIRQAALDVQHWRALADYASPFTFLSTVLGRDGGRRKMLARLGEDARDPLDELLRLARAEETRTGSGLANLEAFLDTLRRLKLTIKRDMEARADKVRIMTVHGSKGLEAKTVFLVDTCSLPKAPSGIVEVPEDESSTNTGAPPLILLASDAKPPAYKAVQDAGHARQLEEYRRLLYVAMTRAADHLIVTGHKKGDGDIPDGCWYDLIDKALAPDARDVGDLDGLPDGDPVRVWRADPWDGAEPAKDAASPAAQAKPDAALMELLTTPTPAPVRAAPLRPSKAHADSALDAETWPAQNEADRHQRTVATLQDQSASAALAFGTLVHRLLEPSTLPSQDQAFAIAKSLDDKLSEAIITKAHNQARAVHDLPEAIHLFGPNARAEVPLRGTFLDARQNARPVSGSIDRLVVLEDEIWAIDFKTNAMPPPEGALLHHVPNYVAQLAVYAELLGQVWPTKPICCALVWTMLPRVDWLSADDISTSLASLRKP